MLCYIDRFIYIDKTEHAIESDLYIILLYAWYLRK